MRAFPIIPVPLMIIFCGILLFFAFRRKKKLIPILIILLIFTINCRFMFPSGTSKLAENNIDVLFAIDSTISMNAEDYNGDEKRLDGVKADCKKIIEELNGARFSLITFNNDAKVMIPFTRDADMTYQAIDIIQPVEKLYAKGTSLNTPKDTVLKALKDSHAKDPDRIRVLFFISDGEITDDSKLESYSGMKKYIDNGLIMGYGTTSGGYMKYNSKYTFSKEDKEEYIMDYTGTKYGKALSQINESNLKKIASDTGLKYVHMDKQSRMTSKLKEIKEKMSFEMKSSNKTNYEDTYFYLVFPLLFLIAIEFKRYRRETI